jgi:hypothetical protein
MSDRTKAISNMIAEHENIKEQLKRAGEAIEDWQLSARLDIQKEHISVKARKYTR